MIVKHTNSSRTTTPQEDFIQKTSSPQNTNEQIWINCHTVELPETQQLTHLLPIWSTFKLKTSFI